MRPSTGRVHALHRFPVLPDACERCGVRPAADRHHLDGDPTNNDRANIAFLCVRCHQVVDGRLERLRERGRRTVAIAQEAAAAKRRAQTHCKHGHEYTPENTRIAPNGARVCRLCAAATNRRYRAR